MEAGNRRFLGGGVAVSGLAAVGTTTSGEVLAASVPFSTAQFLAHWWVFPESTVFSFVALAAGVSGALFFSPFFMLVVVVVGGFEQFDPLRRGTVEDDFDLVAGLDKLLGGLQGVEDTAGVLVSFRP